MSAYVVDYAIVVAAVDRKREALGMSLRKVAAECGVPSGAFSRMKQGLHCSDDNFISIMVWLGVADGILPFLRHQPPITKGKPDDCGE